MLVALSPDNRWEFLTAMAKAWEWAQDRKRFYCETGGAQSIDEYLADAATPDKKQLAIVEDGALLSIVTVRMITDGVFEIHVTSPRKTDREAIVRDAQHGIRSLFEQLHADTISTTCPVYGAHEHRGSRQLAEACGMTPTGTEWRSACDEGIRWREYAITRDTYYGKAETSN